MTNYDRSYQQSKRELKDKVLILCCGETEKIYFELFKETFKYNLQNVYIKVSNSQGKQSLTMVKEAISSKLNYNEIWVLFDKDIDSGFDAAIKKAEKHKIGCAFSNVAFEYWLLLHLIDKSGIMSITQLIRELTNKLGYPYKKNRNMKRVYLDITQYINDAEKRAQNRHGEFIKSQFKNPSDWCSCTNVYTLTRRLRGLL